jgi:predicted HTH transcriptional regulator
MSRDIFFDYQSLANNRESNQLEAKAAQGGLPDSLWQTYSAFANTIGGVILLGVEEKNDHTLYVRGVTDADRLLRDFWNAINNQSKVSVNILSDAHVRKETVDGKEIVVIRVPQASRYDQPVYLNGSILTASYRRNGEGDYRCSKAEVQAMLRDAATQTQDMKLLEDMPLSVLNGDSLRRYRIRMQNQRPGHVWEALEDADFLHRLGAVGRGREGQLHPTVAGLLMFGHEYEIVRELPEYFLDYQERMEPSIRWTDRIISSSGDWSGNVFDFYFRVIGRLEESVRRPFGLEGIYRVEDTAVLHALREALANCVIHADYYGARGLVIVRKPEGLSFSNPGTLRVESETALQGGVSEPRNAVIMKMFNLITIGERAGSGIPSIREAWRRYYQQDIVLIESFAPARLTLSLGLPLANDNVSGSPNNALSESDKIGDKFASQPQIGDKTGDKSVNQSRTGDKLAESSQTSDEVGAKPRETERKSAIVNYLSVHQQATSGDIAQLLHLKASQTRSILQQMTKAGLLVAHGANKNRTYSLGQLREEEG